MTALAYALSAHMIWIHVPSGAIGLVGRHDLPVALDRPECPMCVLRTGPDQGHCQFRPCMDLLGGVATLPLLDRGGIWVYQAVVYHVWYTCRLRISVNWGHMGI